MPGLMGALKMGVSTGLGAFRRNYIDPQQPEGGAVPGQQGYYSLLWAYYDNSAFENIALWSSYKGVHRLYRQMRLIYNPTRRLCDFYAGQVYPGVLTTDPDSLPNGINLAIPLSDDTQQPVKDALAQLWSWSHWQSGKGLLCRYGAITGNVLVEVVDDVEAGQVRLAVVWPGLLSYLDIDGQGEIVSYALRYMARDDDGLLYEYRKEVDRDWFRFYKNSQPYDYGEGTAYPNPYGFVPAVWCKHRDLGGDYGAPAIYGSIAKVDELNSIASHAHDQIHKVIGAPMVLWSDGGVQNLMKQQSQTKGPPTNPYDMVDLDREGILMLKGPAGGRADSLAGNLNLQDAHQYMQLLLTEIEADHPELTVYPKLRDMSQVTGPAATRLMGDVVMLVDEAATNYDMASTRLFQMALAIGGWRANRGDWGSLTMQQRPFHTFDLPSLQNDDLHLQIVPRPLLQTSEKEKIELEQMRLALEQQQKAVAGMVMQESIQVKE